MSNNADTTDSGTAVQVGISIRNGLLQKIEQDRGDVTRSKYITRLIEQAYAQREAEKK